MDFVQVSSWEDSTERKIDFSCVSHRFAVGVATARLESASQTMTTVSRRTIAADSRDRSLQRTTAWSGCVRRRTVRNAGAKTRAFGRGSSSDQVNVAVSSSLQN